MGIPWCDNVQNFHNVMVTICYVLNIVCPFCKRGVLIQNILCIV